MAVECPKCQTENPSDSRFCKDCGAQLTPSEPAPEVTKTLETPAQELTSGTVFASRYEIIEELGKGGMGTVYKALDKQLSEEVALKLIKPEIADDKKTIERFKNELKLARKISHRNVGRMYELMEEEGKPFITMEYVEGEDLKSYQRKKERLSTDEAIGIAKQVCEGLVEAHELGVIHRDLKPQNIMIDDKGRAKIMDFGIARSVEAPGVTATGMIIGTPDYISPEQAEGEEADHRSDIYSLGVILYEMVTGGVPFKGDTALSVAVKHKTQLPQDPKKVNPDISDDLSRLILICMEKDKNRRYQTAEALLADLQNIEDGLPLGTKIRPRRATFAQTLIRKKLLFPAVVAALAIITAGLYFFFARAKPIDSIAVLPFENADSDTEYLSDGIARSLIGKLEGLSGLKKIIAWGSVSRYKRKEIDPQAVGQEFGVDAVLMSQMSQIGDELSISVELIEVKDQSRIWGADYKKKKAEIPTIAGEISNSITNGLQLSLDQEEKTVLAKRYTESPEAWDLYMKGIHSLDKYNIEKSLEYLNQAIEKDSHYAKAYAAIAWNYILQAYFSFHPEELYLNAKEAAEKALDLDETLGQAHSVSATVKTMFEWDWEAAEREIMRALELSPNDATVHEAYAFYLAVKGRLDEALAEQRRALELNPYKLEINNWLAAIYYFMNQDDKAVEQFKKVLEMDPNHLLTHLGLSLIYSTSGRYEEAIASVKKVEDLRGENQETLLMLGIIYANSGKKEKAKEILKKLLELEKQRYVKPTNIAALYGHLGDMDKAFEWLEKGYEDRYPNMCMIRVLGRLRPLRSDPRFKVLLKKMNLD